MSKTASLIIGMPGPATSPNIRAHWSKVSAAKKRSKQLTRAALINHQIERNVPVRAYQLHFTFPNAIKRDFDNFTARCKAALDEISAHVGNDDSQWDMLAPSREIKKGVSTVTITLHY